MLPYIYLEKEKYREIVTGSRYGSQGTLKFTQNKLLGAKKGDQELKEIEIPKDEEGHWRVEEEFVNCIRGLEKVTHTTFSDGVKCIHFYYDVTAIT